MNEKDLENKYRNYLEEEKEIEKLEIKSEVRKTMIGISTAFFSAFPIVWYFFINAMILLASDPSAPVAGNSTNGGQTACILISFFGGMGLIALTWSLIYMYVNGGNSYSFYSQIKESVKTWITSKRKKKELKTRSIERKEFFRFYELMKDENYRNSYLETMKPDETLIKKIMKAEQKNDNK